MAPSPTGPLHIGTARTSLYNYLFARHVGGTYVLRIEDTDLARSTADFERDILDNLHWLGITWDEGPQHAGGDAGGEDIGPSGRIGRACGWTDTPAGGSAPPERCRLPLLVHDRGARRRPPRAGSQQGGAPLQRPVPEPDR